MYLTWMGEIMARSPLLVRPMPTNPSFWVSLAIPVVMIMGLVNNYDPRSLTTWESVFAAANWGLMLGMPIAAAGSAVAVTTPNRWMRKNAAIVNRTLLARLWSDVAPVVIMAFLGYFASLGIILSQTANLGPFAVRSLGPFAVFLTLVLVAVCLGTLFGRLLPGPVAFILAALAQYLVIVFPLLNDSMNAARFGLGYSVPLVLQTTDQQIPSVLIVLPMLIGVALLITLGLAATKRRWLAVPWVVGAALAISQASIVMTAGIEPPGYEARDGSALDCNAVGGTEVCLWPEFAASETSGIRADIEEQVSVLQNGGIAVGSLVTSSQKQAAQDAGVLVSLAPSDAAENNVPYALAVGLRGRDTCDAAETTPTAPNADRAVVALAIALGGEPDEMARLVGAADAAGELLSDAEVLAALGIAAPSDGFALYREWAEAAADLCGKG